ncbi:MAG: hypothetical protein GTO22_07315 [Gemmatimonadales bacterium]|nr:hypothetical protein [Gemmatimonadales bacterium]
MPISYLIDTERGLVLTTASGVLTDDDLLEHKRILAADPDFAPGMRQLSDVRGVERLAVTPEGVRQMVTLDRDQADQLGDYKLAIVTTADVVFGTARMYQSLTDEDLEHVQVFRDMAEARVWLGLPSDDTA